MGKRPFVNDSGKWDADILCFIRVHPLNPRVKHPRSNLFWANRPTLTLLKKRGSLSFCGVKKIVGHWAWQRQAPTVGFGVAKPFSTRYLIPQNSSENQKRIDIEKLDMVQKSLLKKLGFLPKMTERTRLKNRVFKYQMTFFQRSQHFIFTLFVTTQAIFVNLTNF